MYFSAFLILSDMLLLYQYADFLCGAGGTSGDDTDLLSIVLQQIIETFDEQSVHAFDDRVYHADKAFF